MSHILHPSSLIEKNRQRTRKRFKDERKIEGKIGRKLRNRLYSTITVGQLRRFYAASNLRLLVIADLLSVDVMSLKRTLWKKDRRRLTHHIADRLLVVLREGKWRSLPENAYRNTKPMRKSLLRAR